MKNKINIVIIAICFLISFVSISYSEELMSDFKYKKEIKIKDKQLGLFKMYLDGEIIKNTEKYLKDLRIYMDNVYEIPYKIGYEEDLMYTELNEPKTFTKTELENADRLFIDLGKVSKSPTDIILNFTLENFYTDITIYGTNDLEAKNDELEKITVQNIHNMQLTTLQQKKEIIVPSHHFRYLQIDIPFVKQIGKEDAKLQSVNVANVRIKEYIPKLRKENVLKDFKEVTLDLSFEQDSNLTTYLIKNPYEFPIDTVELLIEDKYFDREISLAKLSKSGDHLVYNDNDNINANSSFNKSRNSYKRWYKDTYTPATKISRVMNEKTDKYIKCLFPYITSNDEIILVIKNEDNNPLKIKDIRLKGPKESLIFRIDREDYEKIELFYGNKYIDKPSYDFEYSISTLNKENTLTARFEKQQDNKLFQESWTKGENADLLVRICVIIGLIGFLLVGIFFHIRFKSYISDNSQENEKTM